MGEGEKCLKEAMSGNKGGDLLPACHGTILEDYFSFDVDFGESCTLFALLMFRSEFFARG